MITTKEQHKHDGNGYQNLVQFIIIWYGLLHVFDETLEWQGMNWKEIYIYILRKNQKSSYEKPFKQSGGYVIVKLWSVGAPIFDTVWWIPSARVFNSGCEMKRKLNIIYLCIYSKLFFMLNVLQIVVLESIDRYLFLFSSLIILISRCT